MRRVSYILIVILSVLGCGKKIPSNAQRDIFHVSGNCGMCKKTIEKSIDISGVYDAEWNKKTKEITVAYNPSIISLDEIKQRIAKAGYDNDTYKSTDEDYNGLHSCCKYDRDK